MNTPWCKSDTQWLRAQPSSWAKSGSLGLLPISGGTGCNNIQTTPCPGDLNWTMTSNQRLMQSNQGSVNWSLVHRAHPCPHMAYIMGYSCISNHESHPTVCCAGLCISAPWVLLDWPSPILCIPNNCLSFCLTYVSTAPLTHFVMVWPLLLPFPSPTSSDPICLPSTSSVPTLKHTHTTMLHPQLD